MEASKVKHTPATVMALFDETVVLKETRNEHGFIAAGEADSWFKLIELFRSKVDRDQTALNKHEVAGRGILYKQLADAYKIGLELISDKDLHALKRLAYDHSISRRDFKDDVSPWVYIVKLLYGQWIDTRKWTDVERQENGKKVGLKTDEVKQFVFNKDAPDGQRSVYQAWSPNRSAEKYAVVFRYLHDNNITVDEAASFIENYKHETHGNRLRGIEAAGRAAAQQNTTQKPKSQAVIDKQNGYVARAEARKNWNVFAVEMPNTFPSSHTYARAILKQEGKELLVILVDDADKPMAESAYINQAIKLGKPLLDKENEQAAERQKQLDAVKPQAKQSMEYLAGSDKLAALVADGDDAAEIDAEIQALLDRRRAKLAGTKALEGFTVAEAN